MKIGTVLHLIDFAVYPTLVETPLVEVLLARRTPDADSDQTVEESPTRVALVGLVLQGSALGGYEPFPGRAVEFGSAGADQTLEFGAVVVE